MIDKKLKLEAGLRRLKMKGGSGRGEVGGRSEQSGVEIMAALLLHSAENCYCYCRR